MALFGVDIEKIVEKQEKKEKTNILMYIGIGVGVLIVAFLIYKSVKKK